MDFEQALISAVRHALPNATLGGCYFHLMQIFRRHLTSLGLMQQYRNDPEFTQTASMVPAMAFVPPHRLEEAFRWLREHLFDELQPMLDWFEQNYMGKGVSICCPVSQHSPPPSPNHRFTDGKF